MLWSVYRGLRKAAVNVLKTSREPSSVQRLCTCDGLTNRLTDAESIFALSSGHGRCGVAVVRTSSSSNRSVTQHHDPRTKEVLDRGLVLWFPGPHSFTGEDSAEFHIHGGPAVVAAVLQALGNVPGMRPAEAGEFTRRAFQAGKLGLTEVEGLGDLIHAETEAQRRQALRQMSGDLGRLYHDWSSRLKRCLAHVEAFIDFSEDELIEDGLLNQVERSVSELQSEVEAHLQDQRRGERLRSGVHVVIAGATNAGKSSLLNTLCQRPAAIVSPIAGTTRDVVETRWTSEVSLLEQADLTLLVVDCDQIPSDQETVPFLQRHLKDVLPSQDSRHTEQSMVVLNKLDLLTEQRRQRLLTDLSLWTDPPCVCCVSCHTREGLQDFLSQLHLRVRHLCGDPLSGGPSLTQARHRAHLQQCVFALQQFHRYRDSDLALAAEGVRSRSPAWAASLDESGPRRSWILSSKTSASGNKHINLNENRQTVVCKAKMELNSKAHFEVR
ncbi:hypothetical protein WMY93_024447 [Mugilogobius chulae]|uniref:tRNA modification GTPase GTPBP3, mitochondrial n=1 Tax=Mugilogobius chulae TaxID=88201 RepID=A0AAW0N457_9GOBI